MPLVSIRLPEEVEARLAREAEREQRPKSEIARDAIVDYLQRTERERFIADIARAARARDTDTVLAAAEAALPLDNEALGIGEGVREPTGKYGERNTSRKRGKRPKRKNR
jgi:predicted transcriptional regulator